MIPSMQLVTATVKKDMACTRMIGGSRRIRGFNSQSYCSMTSFLVPGSISLWYSKARAPSLTVVSPTTTHGFACKKQVSADGYHLILMPAFSRSQVFSVTPNSRKRYFSILLVGVLGNSVTYST